MSSPEILDRIVYGMVVLAIGEGMYSYWRKGNADPKEVAANIGVWGLQRVWRAFSGVAVSYGILTFFYRYAPFKLDNKWIAWPFALIGADFIYYWKHRYEHEIRVLWAYHSIHHSSEEFNLSTAMRLPIFGTLSTALFHVPLVLAGVSPVMVIVVRQLVLMYQYWVHSDSIGNLGWFERWFNTPSAHRVHHGSNARYIDKNYGGILILWDKVFGTFEPECAEEPVVYGLTKNIGTQNPLMINFVEPLAIVRDVAGAYSLRDAAGFVFGPPGWKPKARLLATASN